MKGFKPLLNILVLLFSLTVFGQKQYVVNAEALNVRKEPNARSQVIGKFKKGDTITSSINQINNWVAFEYGNGKRAYVSGNFLSKINNPIEFHEEQGFWETFSELNFFQQLMFFMIPVFVGVSAIDQRRKRIPDARFTTGYREIKLEGKDYIKYLIYAIIIGIPLALITTICSLFT